MKIGWLSDIHLNFLEDDEISRFVAELVKVEVDAWMISGDIGESHNLIDYLNILSDGLRLPLYVVLGNHDYYHSSIVEVTECIENISSQSNLVMLTRSKPVFLGEEFSIVGDDGWGDARLGDPIGSQVMLNDFYCISELEGLERDKLIEKLNKLGNACASRLSSKLEVAAEQSENVCIITHVPPYEGAAWHEGRISKPDWLPWFSCEAVGNVISECADRHPDVSFRVFCGHTHSDGYYRASDNVFVYTAGAIYGIPQIQGILVSEADGSKGQHNCRLQSAESSLSRQPISGQGAAPVKPNTEANNNARGISEQ